MPRKKPVRQVRPGRGPILSGASAGGAMPRQPTKTTGTLYDTVESPSNVKWFTPRFQQVFALHLLLLEDAKLAEKILQAERRAIRQSPAVCEILGLNPAKAKGRKKGSRVLAQDQTLFLWLAVDVAKVKKRLVLHWIGKNSAKVHQDWLNYRLAKVRQSLSPDPTRNEAVAYALSLGLPTLIARLKRLLTAPAGPA